MSAQELKQLRAKHKVTQEYIANELGISRERVSEWENGKVNMSNITKKALELLFKDLEKKQG